MGAYQDSFVDYQGEKISVSWNEEGWEEHRRKHPILVDYKRASELILETLSGPSVVFQTLEIREKQTRVYYLQKEVIGNFQVHFIKAIAGLFEGTWYIMTLYDEYSALGLQLKERKHKKVFEEIWNNQ